MSDQPQKNPLSLDAEALSAFFRAPPPAGRSRESRIVLDAEGRFFQDGEPFEHAKLAEAFHTWIGRHPDDGRYILYNGLDWSYFTVEDVPFFVRHLQQGEAGLELVLSDGSHEPLVPERLRAGAHDSLYVQVKVDAPGGPYEAKLTRHAQIELGPHLEPDAEGRPLLRLGDRLHPLPSATQP